MHARGPLPLPFSSLISMLSANLACYVKISRLNKSRQLWVKTFRGGGGGGDTRTHTSTRTETMSCHLSTKVELDCGNVFQPEVGTDTQEKKNVNLFALLLDASVHLFIIYMP